MHPTLAVANASGREMNDLILDAGRGTKRKRNGVLKSIIEDRLQWAPNANTKLFKMFDNDNWIRQESLGRDATRIRGVSADVGIFDEVQMTIEYAVACATKTLTQSQFGVPGQGLQIYLISPNENDFTRKMWEKSSQGQWNYICPECGHRFPLNQDNWETVWDSGYELKCPKCTKLFDKRSCEGVWIDTADDDIFKGFHFHQGQIDMFSKEKIQQVYSYSFNTPKMIANEVWGEWYDEQEG